MDNTLIYWTALSLIHDIPLQRKNEIYVACYKSEPQISIIQLFDNPQQRQTLHLTADEEQSFQRAKEQLPNTSFLVEDLLAQGFSVIPFDHPDYPARIKRNMKMLSPTVLYMKGNPQLLNGHLTAVVDNPENLAALEAAPNPAATTIIGTYSSKKGLKAVETALKQEGKAVLLLPQGITKFAAGFRKYYKFIVRGRLLVASFLSPTAENNALMVPYCDALAEVLAGE